MKSFTNQIVFILSFPGIILMLLSCSDGNHVADAYGNFEADEVLVSAQSQGVLLFLDAEVFLEHCYFSRYQVYVI